MNKENPKKKRACIIRQKSYPEQRNLRRNTETLASEGYQVDVICVGHQGQPKCEELTGITIHRVYYSYHRNNVFWYFLDYFAFFFLVSLKLARLSFRKRFNIIEVCNVPDFLVFATLLPKLLGSKIIFYMFEKSEALFTASFGLSQKHIFTKVYNLITKMCAIYADHVIVTDVVVRKQLLEYYGIRPNKVTLVLNVVDESVFKLEPVNTIDDSHRFRLIIVSTVLKRYGVQTMIKAIPSLLNDIPELKLDIIGDGDYLLDLKRMVSDLQIKEYVNFTGYVPYEEVPPHIARADICIAPMLDDVGTPNKVLEYFAMGKATVSSEIPGLTALVDCDCLSFFQPGNETELMERILELYRSPEKRTALGKTAQEFYNKYRWPLMKQNYLGVYKQLLD